MAFAQNGKGPCGKRAKWSLGEMGKFGEMVAGRNEKWAKMKLGEMAIEQDRYWVEWEKGEVGKGKKRMGEMGMGKMGLGETGLDELGINHSKQLPFSFKIYVSLSPQMCHGEVHCFVRVDCLSHVSMLAVYLLYPLSDF